PDAVEDELEDAEVEPVEVRRHLVEVAAGLAPDAPARHAALGGEPARQARDLRVAQHLLADYPSREQRGAPDDALLAVEEDLEGAREAPDDPLFAFPPVLVDEAAERDFAAERQLDLLRVPQVGEEALRLAGRLLHAVEEGREARLLLA